MLDFFRQRPQNLKNDLLSGLTVSLALVPEAVAFAFVAGVPPLVGLYSAFIIGLVTAVVGGRPGMISAATGAMAVVIVSLVALHGIEYLFPAVILCGLLQVAAGVLHLGKLIRMVPHSVMLGFVNGLAIVIFMAQFGSFKTLGPAGTLDYVTGTPLVVMLALVAITMLTIWLLPRVTTAVPASLVAILGVSLLAGAINHYAPDDFRPAPGANLVATVEDMLLDTTRAKAVAQVAAQHSEAQHRDTAAATAEPGLAVEATAAATRTSAAGSHGTPDVSALSTGQLDAAIHSVNREDVAIAGGFPVPYFMDGAVIDFGKVLPSWSWQTLWIILPFAVILCGVGLIESLMTMTLIDEITGTRGRGNRECVGQGLANIACGVLGGMGGCAMIGQSLINVNSGGRGRLSGVTAAVMLLLFILVLGPWIQMIPMAALVGVMFMVVFGTFEWASLRTFKRIPVSDVVVMLLVAGITVLLHNLALAVLVGVVVSAMVFAWDHATHLFADVKTDDHGTRIYQLHGPLFFASAASFKELFHPDDDPDDVVIDFYYTRVYDQSGLEAINQIAEKYTALNKRLHLRHLSAECRKLLDRAGDLVEINISEDPNYHVATDRLG